MVEVTKTSTEITSPFSGLTNKSKTIKGWYGPEFVKIFARELKTKAPHLNDKNFIKAYLKDYKSLELKDRLRLMAFLIYQNLPGTYNQKLKDLEKIFFKEWPLETGMMGYGFFLYPVAQFIENYALENKKSSLKTIHKLTKRFTGEWAIRTIANDDEKLTLSTLKDWSKDPNFHVRRLASEGLRARLPWGKQIEWVNESPKKTLSIYNKLRNDPVLYVRRSVANSMGDMIKVDDELAYETFNKWLDKKLTPENLWVIKHAIRTPRKKKVPKYMDLNQRLIKIEKSEL